MGKWRVNGQEKIWYNYVGLFYLSWRYCIQWVFRMHSLLIRFQHQYISLSCFVSFFIQFFILSPWKYTFTNTCMFVASLKKKYSPYQHSWRMACFPKKLGSDLPVAATGTSLTSFGSPTPSPPSLPLYQKTTSFRLGFTLEFSFFWVCIRVSGTFSLLLVTNGVAARGFTASARKASYIWVNLISSFWILFVVAFYLLHPGSRTIANMRAGNWSYASDSAWSRQSIAGKIADSFTLRRNSHFENWCFLSTQPAMYVCTTGIWTQAPSTSNTRATAST